MSSEKELLPNETICSRCGMPREEWTGNRGDGVMETGEVYCCQGCAEDSGCTCDYDRGEPDEEPEADSSPAPRSRRSR